MINIYRSELDEEVEEMNLPKLSSKIMFSNRSSFNEQLTSPNNINDDDFQATILDNSPEAAKSNTFKTSMNLKNRNII